MSTQVFACPSKLPSLSGSPQNLSTMASDDRDVLLVLFRSTCGAKWTNSANWGTDADVSRWHGVEGNDEGRVKLNLHGNNLRGILGPRHQVLLSWNGFDLSQGIVGRKGFFMKL